MDFLLIGPPGAGKGTQAAMLQGQTSLKHLASGELFRQHMLRETALGRVARSYVDKGELVPDELVIEMILERMREPDCGAGVIFDGFPRTIEQASALAQALAARGRSITAVLFLSVPRNMLLKRIGGRQTCRTCQTPYNLYYEPPQVEGVCDRCGGDLYTRSDDNLATASHRLDVYFAQTMPLIEHYRVQGLLHEIDGAGEIGHVAARLRRALEFTRNGRRQLVSHLAG